MSVNPKYYYNLSENITDGKKEYSLHHKEDKIGGLSVSSGLKENYIEYGTNSLLDLLNELHNENAELHIQLDFLKDENHHMRDLVNENKQLKKELKRCKDWINSDKNDYELTLAFIKNKGYSLRDVLEYEKELSE